MSARVDDFNAYLERGELRFEYDNERSLFRMALDGQHGDVRVVILVEDSMLQVFSHPANKVPEAHRISIAQAIARANYGLKIGKFELDLDDGELRYQAAVPLGETMPDDSVLDHFLYVGGAMIDRYLPAFLAIMYGNEDVKLAIQAAEL